jgi:hypothetical protein
MLLHLPLNSGFNTFWETDASVLTIVAAASLFGGTRVCLWIEIVVPSGTMNRSPFPDCKIISVLVSTRRV